MVTGASTADLALVLVDARAGVVEQSKRHAFISSLLRIPHLVVCVNKMDLVDWSEERLRARSATSSPTSPAGLELRGDQLHPGERAARRQRRRPLREHALVPGADAAAPPRARGGGLRPQLRRRPLPGAVGHPPPPVRAPRLPRLRRPGGGRRARARRRAGGAALRAAHADRGDRHLRRRAGRTRSRRCRSPCCWRTTSTSAAAT